MDFRAKRSLEHKHTFLVNQQSFSFWNRVKVQRGLNIKPAVACRASSLFSFTSSSGRASTPGSGPLCVDVARGRLFCKPGFILYPLVESNDHRAATAPCLSG